VGARNFEEFRIRAVEGDGAGVRLFEASDHPQGRVLAAARRTEQREELAGCDVEVEAVDGHALLEPLGDSGQRQVAGICRRSLLSFRSTFGTTHVVRG
jgi:hypothetical protein